MYLEYLWAADWPELPAHCDYRSTLAWLDLADCFHRSLDVKYVRYCYTFSHAMLRGQNLTIFAFVGALVAACLTMVEHQRVRCLTSLLKMHSAKGNEDSVRRCLEYLAIYSRLMDVAFPGVLLLVTFLDEPANDLQAWAQRHQSLKWKAGCIIALHFVLPASAAVHHFAWLDATGRLFGLCEVSAILSYQIFLASFVTDDFAAVKFAVSIPTSKAAASLTGRL
eukprot:g1084.t1